MDKKIKGKRIQLVAQLLYEVMGVRTGLYYGRVHYSELCGVAQFHSADVIRCNGAEHRSLTKQIT